VANRDKDRRFCQAAARARLAHETVLLERLELTEVRPEVRALVEALIRHDFSGR
jgi:hypothetical protein